ncbi:hypothetical protein G6M87_10980 [Rhizobium rhizogenes]|uniref:head-tail connector protein n=1 Tax=Rhizobium rhizogenes TaxID=359 RepID=UPI001572A423|nr:phage head-tail connector protein [Rhizobium rhizogenes]NTI22381.1 hypothetical protein [Rhizobium rhizogenes]QTG05967.1 hypothetical protein G6M87_10980 [Rhizobium rhizogenes]
MKPKLIQAPADGPLTLESVKAHLRVFFLDDDEYIQGLIKVAMSHLDGYRGILNRCILSQQWQTTRYRFCRRMETLFTDTTAVVVTYYDADDEIQTVADTDYIVYPDYILFKRGFVTPAVNRDRDDCIMLTSTHGYDEVPDTLILGMKILIAHWYRNREPVAFGTQAAPLPIPFAADMLIAPHRWAF